MSNNNSFTSGDNRNDRDPEPFMDLGDTDLFVEQSEDDNQKKNSDSNLSDDNEVLEDINISEEDAPAEKKKLLTVKNAFFAGAGLFVAYIVYAILTAPNASKPSVASSQSNDTQQVAKQKQKQIQTVQEPNVTSEEIKVLNSELSNLKLKINDLQQNNADLNEKYSLTIQKIEYLESKYSSESSADVNVNDITTKVVATLLPEIKKHAEANAARVKKELLKTIPKAPVESSSQVQKASPPVVSKTTVPANISNVGEGARNLVFVMATNDLMLVTTQDDPTQRVITLRPGELVKGRGVIKNISPRGCIVFEDNTMYEVMNREGSCSNAP
jgi:hypothetical protein